MTFQERSTLLIAAPPEDRKVIRNILENEWTIIEKENEEKAVQALKIHSREICCVLLGGTSEESFGLRLAGMIRELDIYTMPVLMMMSAHQETLFTRALELGADGAIDPLNENLNQRLSEILGTDGADVVIECVGSPRTAAQAIDAARRCGRIVLFGVPHPEALLQTSLYAIYQKELTILGSFVNPDTHSRAVALIASGRLKLKPLITHRFPVSRLEDAIKMQTSAESIKVLVAAEGN